MIRAIAPPAATPTATPPQPPPTAAPAAGARRVADLLVSLSLADMRARYGRDPLRFVKWMLDSMALVAVYLVLRTILLDRGGPAPGLSLACAVVPFHLMMMTVFNSMTTVRDRRSIVLNVGFNRTLLPASSACTEAIAFSGGLVLLAGLMAVYAVAPTAAILWLPVVVAVTVLFVLSLAYPASLFGTWFPEWQNIARSLVRMLFFLAPGIIALNEIPASAQGWVKLNPLTGIFEAFRDVLLYGSAPAVWELAYPLGFALAVFAIFVPVYRREQRHLAKVI
jgi:ABC-type polysaccharide/polyol phosphate export permease